MIQRDRSNLIVTAIGMAVVAFSILLPQLAFAQAGASGHGPTIFEVRRSLPLEPDEPTFHDFYINAGPEAGFKKGQYITVVRSLPIQDPILNKQQAVLDVTVGYLQVIQVQRGITVGRLYGELPDDERPALEFEAVMIGDRIDMASLTSKAPKIKEKAKPKTKGFFTENEGVGSSASPVAVAVVSQPGAQAGAQAGAQPGTQVSQASSIAAPAQVAQPRPEAGSPSERASGEKAPGATASAEPATTSLPSEKTIPQAASPDIVRVPVPAVGGLAAKGNSDKSRAVESAH